MLLSPSWVRSSRCGKILAAVTTAAIASCIATATAASAQADPGVRPLDNCASSTTIYDRGRTDVRRAADGKYVVYFELFPYANPLATSLESVQVHIFANGRQLEGNNGNLYSGHSRPLTDLFHGRFSLFGATYRNDGDAPWTHHAVKPGDIITFQVHAIDRGPNYIGEAWGDHACKA